MRRLLMARGTIALGCAAIVCGCSAILGDFSLGTDNGVDGGGPGIDSGPPSTGDGSVDIDGAGNDGEVPDGFVPPGDDGGDASVEDAPFDAPPDVILLPDVGPPANPGVAMTVGGVSSKSAHFKVVGALGESPGGNLTAQSANYKLHSGVIGATH